MCFEPGTRSMAIVAAFSSACLLSAMASAQQVTEGTDARRFFPDDPLWLDSDNLDIPSVEEFELLKDYDFVENSFGDPASFDGPAVNVNTIDEVPDSSWFTNRIGRREMSLEEILRGPNTTDGPAIGAWRVTGRPWAGITPKFTIKDGRGDTYLIKLDPSHAPGLVSTAEVISTKIFYAIGYHVAEYYLVSIDVPTLEVEPGARFKFDSGEWLPITHSDLEHWLRAQPRQPDGTIRAVASKYLTGKPVGQFKQYGTRSDDPNDLFPHELRRELRGYRVFAAWLNHDDSRSLNTFDSYLEEGGRHYIRHYLLDFGSNLGSGSTNPQEPRGGYEYYIEKDKILKGIFTFGLWSRDWMHATYPRYTAVGNFEADFFEPGKWKPNYPNPAFKRMDGADAFWAASLVSRFSDEALRAIVADARVGDPEAERYLEDVIIKRRDKVVKHWIVATNPLDSFSVTKGTSGWTLDFDNAAVRVGAAKSGASYHVQWSNLDNLAGREQPVGDALSLDEPHVLVPSAAWGPMDDVGDRYAIGSIRTAHPDFPHWNEPVVVSLRDRNAEVQVVGIRRPRTSVEP